MDRPDDPAFWPEDATAAYFDSDEGWASAAEIEAHLDSLEGPYATRVDIGVSREGRPISALRISAAAHPTHALRILATHHGNEPVGAFVALDIAERLIADPTLIPYGAEVWVVPDVNPDGLEARSRENALGVDLNRNYDYEWGLAINPGEFAFSEPETRAIRALTRARCWLGGLTLHSGASNIGWTWNYTADTRAPDEPLLATIGVDYLNRTTTPGFWATDGADWYPTHGDSTDWSYGRWGIPEFTLELGDEKAPADVEEVLGWHGEAILYWLSREPDLLSIAVASLTGEPIPVVVASVQPTTSPTGGSARWSDSVPVTWSSPGFEVAGYGQPMEFVGTSVSPRLISRADGVQPLPDGWVGLGQPGEAYVALSTQEGLDPDALAPGLWDVHTVDGVAPRSLLIGEVDDHVRLDDVSLHDGTLTLVGAGFGRGAEAFGVGGPVRAMHALAPVSATATLLEFVWSPGDDTFVLWTSGAWLGAVGMDGAPSWDEAPPATEVIDGDTAHFDPVGYYGGGCAGAQGGAGQGGAGQGGAGQGGAAGLLLLFAVPRRAGRSRHTLK
ncbi:MAG: hypothetical protein EXR69_06010 [Myxococcales bacterium]|nr:hypothetical protein [Myxococcales bacterium]